jgi:hypothetical protein
MYQHYVTAARVAQHQQQLMDEATIARQVRAGRQGEQSAAQPGPAKTAALLATRLHNLRSRRMGGVARPEIANPR